jgi:hypothetical protein
MNFVMRKLIQDFTLRVKIFSYDGNTNLSSAYKPAGIFPVSFLPVYHFTGNVSVTNNGFSLIPTFSLGKPALISTFSMGG